MTKVVTLRKATAKPLPKISAMALDTASRKRGKVANPFAFPDFPPGVKPKNRTMARDSALASAGSWAAAGFSGWGAQAWANGLEFLGYPYLAELSQRPEYRVIAETISAESTRKGVKFSAGESDDEATATKLKEIEKEWVRLKVMDHARVASEQDCFFGRSHLYLDTGATDERDELKTPIGDGWNKISQKKISKTNPLRRLANVEPVWTYPTSYNSNDPLAPDWYAPECWFVMGKQLHRSRLLTYVGRPVPDLLKPSYSFGGLSMSQMVKPYVDNWLRTRQSVADLVSAFSVMGLKSNLAESLASDGEQMFARAELFTLTRDNRGTMMLDKDTEEFFNVAAPLGTLDTLQAQTQEHMAAICRIPLVKLLGISPHGLNASSEGEIKVWYDWIEAYQELFHRPNLHRILGFVQLSLYGKIDESITFKFEKLESMDDKEQAELEKVHAETDSIRIDQGTIGPDEVRAAIVRDPNSPYNGLDANDMPEPEENNEEQDDNAERDEAFGKSAQDERVIPFTGGGDDFKETDHPRGQPGNAGQFGAGGGKLIAPQFGMPNGKFTASGSSSSKAPRKSNIGAPLDPSKLKKVGEKKGSNPGGVYEDNAGKRYYVKQGKSKDHVRNEMTAAALYDLAGTPTLDYRPTPDGTHIATEMAKLDKDNASKLSATERSEAAQDFAVHAWLGNWDAVGLGGDNLGTVNGTPTALDLGGAMEYRAQGSPKGKAFGNSVGELDTLRDKKMNADAAKIFGAMTPSEMRESARHVTDIPDDKIRSVVEGMGGDAALAKKLIARKHDIADKARFFGQSGEPSKADSTVVIPVGTGMPVKELNGVAFKPYEPPADWASVEGQADIEEPTFDANGKAAASGVIIREPDGRVWLIQPRDGYGGYDATFPKGRVEEGLSMQANAIKEAYEESGLKVKITGHALDAEGDSTTTRYYYAERESGDPSQHDDESEGVVLAPKDKAEGFLNRKRDRETLGAMDATFEEGKHPRKSNGEFGSGTKPVSIPMSERAHADLKKHFIEQISKKGGSGERTVEVPLENLRATQDTTHGSGPASGEEGDAPIVGVMDAQGHVHVINGHHRIERAKAEGKNSIKARVVNDKDAMDSTVVISGDDFKESDHPRGQPGNAGQFGPGGGGSSPAQHSMIAAKVLSKPAGISNKYRQALKELIAGAEGETKAKLTAKLAESYAAKHAQSGEEKYKKAAEKHGHKFDAPMHPEAQKIVDNITAQVQAEKQSSATPAELEKAKKNVQLQLSYVPGGSELQFDKTKAQAQKFINEFNDKYVGAQHKTDAATLEQKVKDFKTLTASIAAIKKVEDAHASTLANEQQKQAAENAAKQKAAQAAAAQEAAAKNAGLMKELGINEQEALGFGALVKMLGGSQADAVAAFKDHEEKAKSLGYPISGFQAALIKNYSGSGYRPVNKALRSGSWSEAQHVYVKMVNKALQKMPTHDSEGEYDLIRNTPLTADQQKKYMTPGHIILEDALMSTSTKNVFSGNTRFKVKACGKRGAQIKKLSSHPGENEVLFSSHTFFKVTKIEGQPGLTGEASMIVYMEEMDD